MGAYVISARMPFLRSYKTVSALGRVRGTCLVTKFENFSYQFDRMSHSRIETQSSSINTTNAFCFFPGRLKWFYAIFAYYLPRRTFLSFQEFILAFSLAVSPKRTKLDYFWSETDRFWRLLEFCASSISGGWKCTTFGFFFQWKGTLHKSLGKHHAQPPRGLGISNNVMANIVGSKRLRFGISSVTYWYRIP